MAQTQALPKHLPSENQAILGYFHLSRRLSSLIAKRRCACCRKRRHRRCRRDRCVVLHTVPTRVLDSNGRFRADNKKRLDNLNLIENDNTKRHRMSVLESWPMGSSRTQSVCGAPTKRGSNAMCMWRASRIRRTASRSKSAQSRHWSSW